MGLMEKREVPLDSGPATEIEDDRLTLTGERARAMLDRYDRDREEAKKRRQAGRPKGVLADALIGNLRSCNILQLRNAKKLCDRLIDQQRKPPLDQDCGKRYTIRVLASITVKNERYRLEFDRSSLNAPKVYAKGPYVRRYWWDGAFVQWKHVKKDKHLRTSLPKKVWTEFRHLLENPENKRIRFELSEKLQRENS
jgi:hypothetical protein